jgi:hypothetical protein
MHSALGDGPEITRQYNYLTKHEIQAIELEDIQTLEKETLEVIRCPTAKPVDNPYGNIGLNL